MSEEKLPAQDFVDKVAWEGGIFGAIDYGLDSSNYALPTAVEHAWQTVKSYVDDLEELIKDFETTCAEAGLEL